MRASDSSDIFSQRCMIQVSDANMHEMHPGGKVRVGSHVTRDSNILQELAIQPFSKQWIR